MLVPEVWDENEDLGRDPVDWGEPVPPELDRTEDLQSVLPDSKNLKHDIHQHPLTCPANLLVVNLVLAQGSCDAVNSHFRYQIQLDPTLLVYLLPEARSSSSFLAARKRRDIEEPPPRRVLLVVKVDMIEIHENLRPTICDVKLSAG